jgi:hypothetical protein
LADNAEDETLEQFPGQGAESQSYDTSRGSAVRYTSVLSPALINVFNYGFTRLSTEETGVSGYPVTFTIANLNAYPRAFSRIAPTTNLVNDLTWNKGRHTAQAGFNLRHISNDRLAFSNSFPSFSFSRNTLKGLGQISMPRFSLLPARSMATQHFG